MNKDSFVRYAKKYTKLYNADLDKEIKKLQYSILSVQALELINGIAYLFNFEGIDTIVYYKINRPISHLEIGSYVKNFLINYINNHDYSDAFYSVLGKEKVKSLVEETFNAYSARHNKNYRNAIFDVQDNLWMHWNIQSEEKFGYSIFSKSKPCNEGVKDGRIVISFIDEEYEIPAKVALELLNQELKVATLVKQTNANKRTPNNKLNQAKKEVQNIL